MSQAIPQIDRIAYGFEHESWESKVDWFGGLTPAERLRHLDQLYRLAVGLNPKLREGNDAGHSASSLRVLELPRRWCQPQAVALDRDFPQPTGKALGIKSRLI